MRTALLSLPGTVDAQIEIRSPAIDNHTRMHSAHYFKNYMRPLSRSADAAICRLPGPERRGRQEETMQVLFHLLSLRASSLQEVSIMAP